MQALPHRNLWDSEAQHDLPAAFQLALLCWLAGVQPPKHHPRVKRAQEAPAGAHLRSIVQRINDYVGCPAEAGRTASRASVGIPEDVHMHIDVGGEGRLCVDSFTTGFPGAINLNDTARTTVTPEERPIPLLVRVQPWHTDPAYPFAAGFADRITMMGAPLTDKNVTEIARVLRDPGVVDLWVDDAYRGQILRLAELLGGRVTYPGEEEDFVGNGGVHRRVRVTAGSAGACTGRAASARMGHRTCNDAVSGAKGCEAVTGRRHSRDCRRLTSAVLWRHAGITVAVKCRSACEA